MHQAINAVNKGEMRLFHASKHYNVPRSTLRDRVNGTHPASKAGAKRVLSDKVEKELFSLAKKRAKFGLTIQDFLEIAGDVAAENNMPFPSGRPSVTWFNKMMKRNRQVSVEETDSDSSDSSDETDASAKDCDVLKLASLRKNISQCHRKYSRVKNASRKSVKEIEPESDPDTSVEINSSSENNTSFDSNASDESRHDPSVSFHDNAPIVEVKTVVGDGENISTSQGTGKCNLSVENTVVKSQIPRGANILPVSESNAILSVDTINLENETQEIVHVPVSCVEETVTVCSVVSSDPVIVSGDRDYAEVVVGLELEVSNNT
jgi:hypothetical protein